MQQANTLAMSHHLTPRCPRDSHVMRYEPKGIRWRGSAGQVETLASYHCPYIGCSVRYDPANGYFTVINEPDLPYFVDEPAANLVRCPRHGTWLYREARNRTEDVVLKCGVDGCNYAYASQSGV
jgi:hypothetical protein